MLTPLDIHNKEFKRSLRGYDMDEVDEFLDDIIRDYEELYKDNLDLKDRLESYKENINQYKNLEETLNNTLLLAQQTADELKQNAEKEASLIIKDAEKEAEDILAGTKEDILDLTTEYNQLQNTVQQFRSRFKGFLLAQLDLIKEGKEEKKESKGRKEDKANLEVDKFIEFKKD